MKKKKILGVVVLNLFMFTTGFDKQKKKKNLQQQEKRKIRRNKKKKCPRNKVNEYITVQNMGFNKKIVYIY